MVGALPDDFQEVNYFEAAPRGLLLQRLANLKVLDDATGKAELVVYSPLGRRNLKDVPHTPGVAGGWGYPGEQPAGKPAAAAK